jgi:CheY-like chemotaxis protein
MILIVENDVRVRDVTVVILQSGGYQVSAVANGKEALRFLENNEDVELVLTDIVMPLMDGFDLFTAARVRPNSRNLPFLVMTGGCPPSRLPAGVKVLRKPFRMQTLLDAVRDELAGTPRQDPPWQTMDTREAWAASEAPEALRSDALHRPPSRPPPAVGPTSTL